MYTFIIGGESILIGELLADSLMGANTSAETASCGACGRCDAHLLALSPSASEAPPAAVSRLFARQIELIGGPPHAGKLTLDVVSVAHVITPEISYISGPQLQHQLANIHVKPISFLTETKYVIFVYAKFFLKNDFTIL